MTTSREAPNYLKTSQEPPGGEPPGGRKLIQKLDFLNTFELFDRIMPPRRTSREPPGGRPPGGSKINK